MKLNSIFYGLALTLVVMGLASCKDDPSDYIPPAIHPHGSGDEVVPDELGWTVHEEGQPYDTYKGLIMCGYQGWFGTPGDGSPMTAVSNQGWYHYRESEQFRPGVLRNSIDFWPDMREYEHQYTPGLDETERSSQFILPDGSAATVFSSYDEQTVLLHFKWMKDYGIDGVFMQRFLGEVVGNADHKDHFDVVLRHAMKGSNDYGRAIAVMYDMSGATASMLGGMVRDAQQLMDTYQLLDRSKQKYYLYENGKPLLALWGVGFSDRTYDTLLPEIIAQLKEQGWSIMLGCPAYWREGGSDAKSGTDHAALLSLIKSADVFMPWYVGRYGYDNFNDTWRTRIAKDIQWAKDNSLVYAVHVYPGGSDRNMHPGNGMSLQGDTWVVPADRTGGRYGGRFYWTQLANAVKQGAEAIYVGMFDEIDEGTAIFKQLNVSQVPSNEYYDGPDYYVTYTTSGNYSIGATDRTGANGVRWSLLASQLNVTFQGIDDELPTDHYLWLTGKAAQMLNRKLTYTEELPNR